MRVSLHNDCTSRTIDNQRRPYHIIISSYIQQLAKQKKCINHIVHVCIVYHNIFECQVIYYLDTDDSSSIIYWSRHLIRKEREKKRIAVKRDNNNNMIRDSLKSYCGTLLYISFAIFDLPARHVRRVASLFIIIFFYRTVI